MSLGKTSWLFLDLQQSAVFVSIRIGRSNRMTVKGHRSSPSRQVWQGGAPRVNAGISTPSDQHGPGPSWGRPNNSQSLFTGVLIYEISYLSREYISFAHSHPSIAYLFISTMPQLAQAQYGKDNIRVYKVHKDEKAGTQDVTEFTVRVLLSGDIETS